jgi:hypothetical protein
MPADQLQTIERTTIVLGVAAVATAGLIWGPRGMAAAGAGAALAVANFWVLRRLGARAVAKVEAGASTGQALGLVLSLAVKMLLLFGLVWVAIRRLGLPVLPFTLGLSVFVASILFGGLYLGPQSLKVPPAAPAVTPDIERFDQLDNES